MEIGITCSPTQEYRQSQGPQRVAAAPSAEECVLAFLQNPQITSLLQRPQAIGRTLQKNHVTHPEAKIHQSFDQARSLAVHSQHRNPVALAKSRSPDGVTDQSGAGHDNRLDQLDGIGHQIAIVQRPVCLNHQVGGFPNVEKAVAGGLNDQAISLPKPSLRSRVNLPLAPPDGQNGHAPVGQTGILQAAPRQRGSLRDDDLRLIFPDLVFLGESGRGSAG